MKRILIGTLVGAIIFFGFQSAMWMGGFHDDIFNYSPKQDSLLQDMAGKGLTDGVYAIPFPDPNAKDKVKAREEFMKNSAGKPWAMVFYHSSMHGDEAGNILRGAMHAFLASLLVALILYNGRYASFLSRFMVSMAIAILALCLCTFSDMNWWGYPWSFVKPQVMDLSIGWGLCSLWLAYYVKNGAVAGKE